jgi:hypothetical protein
MDPKSLPAGDALDRLPRTRGDGPLNNALNGFGLKAPPHTRGWTCSSAPGRSPPSGSPAHAQKAGRADGSKEAELVVQAHVARVVVEAKRLIVSLHPLKETDEGSELVIPFAPWRLPRKGVTHAPEDRKPVRDAQARDALLRAIPRAREWHEAVVDGDTSFDEIARAESGTRTVCNVRGYAATYGKVGPFSPRCGMSHKSGNVGWGTWIRTKIDRVRVGSSTVELSPKEASWAFRRGGFGGRGLARGLCFCQLRKSVFLRLNARLREISLIRIFKSGFTPLHSILNRPGRIAGRLGDRRLPTCRLRI